MQIKVGDLEKGMEDVIQSLEKAMTELNLMDIATGDPKYLETLMKKLNVSKNHVVEYYDNVYERYSVSPWPWSDTTPGKLNLMDIAIGDPHMPWNTYEEIECK